MKRTLTLILSVLMAAGLAGCYPTATGAHGTHHNLKMVVAMHIGGKPAGVKVRIIKSDVVIRTGEHAINRDSGAPFPASWTGITPQQSEIDYWTDSNPTTFTFIAQVEAPAIRGENPAPFDTIVRLGCYFDRDGTILTEDEVQGHQEDVITMRVVQMIDRKHAMRVSCSWVDRSK